MIPKWVFLRTHSHCNNSWIFVQNINWLVEQLCITCWFLECHCHDVECTCFTSSIWSKKPKHFTFLNTKSIIVHCCHSVAVNLHQLASLNKILVTIRISSIWIIPNSFSELPVFKYILFFVKLHPLVEAICITVKSFVRASATKVNQDVKWEKNYTLSNKYQ